ncbi:MAG: aminomethyl-transferring glycine dehydrogenase, partial [Bacteroidales bacterium]|nr:aminomethyl-transferring glycine dehydrogenase [Bacteroidales bacterium]
MKEDSFIHRHIGPNPKDVQEMLALLGEKSLDEFISKVMPDSIKLENPLELFDGLNEYEYFNKIKSIAAKNTINKSYIGLGYYNTLLPSVIKRNILENPGWYTSYTPYQAEISQGRLEALLNYQTMITELTAMPVANASLLDEATAAAEAMLMLYNARPRQQQKENVKSFFVEENVFPQTVEVIQTRAEALGIKVEIGKYTEVDWTKNYFGAIVQYPCADGEILHYDEFVETAHGVGCKIVVAADLLSLTILRAPGEWNADVVVGSSQRFGIPMWYGGPHAGYFATLEEFKRFIPGRIIGVSKDKHDRTAYRMALQTREQHIRREKATSNICTAQALLAIISGMYAISHGPEGLKNIAVYCHNIAGLLNGVLESLGYNQVIKNYFDTLRIKLPKKITQDDIRIYALERDINLRYFENGDIGISVDETTSVKDANDLIEIFAAAQGKYPISISEIEEKIFFESRFVRKSSFLQQDVFNRYRSETELMRYMKLLENKDISLTRSMISLGSCTMKLNSAIELLSLAWSDFAEIHPFAPIEQTEGYQQLFYELGKILKTITGLPGVSFQPNSGAAGEYAGLMVIRRYFNKKNDAHRDTVLIPASAHGTNPASAVMAGFKVVVVKCDDNGNIDMKDLEEKAKQNKDNLAAFMVTYPSTHGVFEERIIQMTSLIHKMGGQVYLDGANMNAQVGLTNPAKIGADVCHLNLHKTFAIPHGGGGPGAGPICVAEHLVEFLPSHPLHPEGGVSGVGAISAAPYGSAGILTISHAYCYLLGDAGLTYATKIAILNANYLAEKLKNYYNILYTGEKGYVAHEMIIDCRPFKQLANITETDVAKRLMDYGYHAPTLSFPVHGTLMVEPTESESKTELDQFVDALISIYNEIKEVS